jgi:hypothetical protein
MSRTSNIIVIVKIMVELLEINFLLWCPRAAVRMAMGLSG